MSMWRYPKQEDPNTECTAVEFPTNANLSDTGETRADKSTQTFFESGNYAIYYSPRGDPNAHQLKNWMNKIFDNKLPDLNS